MRAKPFVHFWESVTSKERARERADYVLKPINKYCKKARRIIEIGCGIGEVLVNFPKKYEIYGLDIEKDYINACKRKIPRGKFFVSSMHNFKINKKFDVIFSADDAINFMEPFAQWESTFKSVSSHLNEDGLFIFDIYTPKMLKDDKGRGPTIRKVSIGYYCDKGIIKNNTLTWDVKIFEKLPNGLYQLHEYTFKETIYSIAKVKAALYKHFKILETNFRENKRKILFVCEKK